MSEGSLVRTKMSLSDFSFLEDTISGWLKICHGGVVKRTVCQAFKCNTGLGTKQLDPSSVPSSFFTRAQKENRCRGKKPKSIYTAYLCQRKVSSGRVM